MAKYPKTPKGSINPYERKLEPKYTATEQQELRGCGDPNCEMCNPKNREGSPMGGYSREDEYRRLKEMMMRNMYYSAPSVPPIDTAYDEAREAVEDFILETPPSVDWSHVHGNDEAKAALLEAVEYPLKHAEIYAFYNMTPPKGILLYGPPGCGKTMFGKAAASAIARLHGKTAEMLVINGAQLQSPWVGVTEAQIVSFFTYAKLYHKKHSMPLTIFIDEADAILPARNGSARFEVSNVSTFLAEMDGVKESNAFIILATNRPEQLDEAVLRDGRIDRKIKVNRPDLASITAILKGALAFAPTLSTLSPTELTDYIVAPERIVSPFQAYNSNGDVHHGHITLANIINGAMLVGIIARAKSIAFARDIKLGRTTGLTQDDLQSAVDLVLADNIGLPHNYAMEEMLETLNLEAKRRVMN